MTTAQVYLTRLANEHAQWEELIACLPLARAYFGRRAEQALDNFWKQRGAIDVAARMYAEELDRKHRQQYEGDLWCGYNQARNLPDPIDSAIEQSIATLEEVLLPILAPPEPALD